jgi:hypothetical protein
VPRSPAGFPRFPAPRVTPVKRGGVTASVSARGACKHGQGSRARRTPSAAPFGKLRAGSFGKLRAGSFGKLRAGSFGKLRAHSVSDGTPGGEFPSEGRAAIVTYVNRPGDARHGLGLVSRCVLNPTGLCFNQRVPYGGEGNADGTWHSPEHA